MNKQIKELAIKAGLIAPYGSDLEGLSEFDYRMFAELIVRECADIAKGEPASFYDRDAYKLGRKFASEDVLKHFGVEE